MCIWVNIWRTYADRVLDAKKHNEINHFEIPEEGFVLEPNTLYLGVTQEYTETHKHVPFFGRKIEYWPFGN
jgi:dCTP deaminase